MVGTLALKRAGLLAALVSMAVWANGCSTLPTDVDRPVSKQFTDTQETLVGRYSSDQMRGRADGSGFYPLNSGLDAFVARAVFADAAERSIDAQYYLYHSDLTGKLLIDRLIRAADRGVRVRLLVDDMDLAGRDIGAATLDSHPNIEVRMFNPFSRQTSRWIQLVTRFGSVTRRMHNKSFTVDNQASILGGRNIGDEYFDANPKMAFADMDVLLIGPVVPEVSESFDRYWNSELAYPATALLGRVPTDDEITAKRGALNDFVVDQEDSVYLIALRNSDLANRLRNESLQFEWGDAHIVYDEPEKIVADRSKTEYHLSPQLRQYFHDTHDELVIVSPYFVPGKAGAAFLSELSERGVQVRVVTNSLASTDVPVVHSGYARYRKRLLRSGVELYEMKPQQSEASKRTDKHWAGSSNASLHSKVFVFDREYVFIGSLNLDPRSIKENTEIGVVLTSSRIGTQAVTELEQVIPSAAYRLTLETDENGNERIVWIDDDSENPVRFNVDPNTGFWQRAAVAALGLFPIESQL